MILFIHRKDLRVRDLPSWDRIAADGRPSLHVLILDPFLLRDGRSKEHSGSNFLLHVRWLKRQYEMRGKHLHLLYGQPEIVVRRLLEQYPIERVMVHSHRSPYSLRRDAELKTIAAERHVLFEDIEEEMLVDWRDFSRWSGRLEGYKVFTPFYLRWRDYVRERRPLPYKASLEDLETAILDEATLRLFSPPEDLGKNDHSDLDSKGMDAIDPDQTLRLFLNQKLGGYGDNRDRFGEEGTSRIGRHLNAGALSIREIFAALTEDDTLPGGETWLRQLAWRDFYLYQAWMNADFFTYEKRFDLSDLRPDHFPAWAEGRTGIPIVDAAMKELNETGWMPNRLRMVTAMFLTKNLGCPFIYGERYFRLKLADYDNVLNRGGWLWSSSLGYDAAPYFRVMNPASQSRTHDPDGAYIRRWLPELAGLSAKEIHLPRPEAIVDLKRSRAFAIETYRRILSRTTSIDGDSEG